MIYYLILILVINIIGNYFHKAIIIKNSGLWHTLSAIYDTIIVSGFLILIKYELLKIYNILDIIMLTFIYLSIRLISRDIMLGVGTTAWMDRHVKGFYRLALYLFCIFFIFIYIYHYFKYY